MKEIMLAAASAALLAAMGPGAAPTTPAPGQGLVLTAATRTATLNCDQVPRGTHPLRLPACTALSAANGDFDALPGQPAVCRVPYQPVTVTAEGEFRGQPVHWRKKFANSCVLRAATGPVFAFA
ncbi:SSI family serine proteinase inhibitor [Actinacidiphila paucisporea]|uniref:SSI family serine proteinase inhibitor n=1 Tax=Actinacidiphila paucisporea TaxID=310782 RepID=UPI001F40A5D0|nr:SSI family serine proteinase inhibitor [Actinacidiphila paucisporea]